MMLKFQYYLLLINIIYTKINTKINIKTNIKIIIKVLFITNIKIFTHPFKIIFSFFIFITFIKLIHNKFHNL